MKPNLRLITIVTLALSCFAFLAFYFFQFRNYSLSSNSDDWGNFGSYFAGGLGTILGFANLFLLYYTYNSQRKIGNQQQFESTFFELLKNHRENIFNAIDSRANLHNLNSHEDSSLSESYQLLKELYEIESDRMLDALYASAEMRIILERKYILTYRPLFNYNILSKDYLVVIINSIADIYNYVNGAKAVDEEVKQFYKNVLRDSITESEKFFLVLFFMQQKSLFRKKLSKDDILFFINQNADLRAYLLLDENFPFSSCGLVCKSKSGYFPFSSFGIEIKNLLNENIEYKIKPLLKPFIVEKILISSSVEQFNFIVTVNERIERMGQYHFAFNEMFENILMQLKPLDPEKTNPFQILNIIPPERPGSSYKSLELELEIYILLGEKKFTIYDFIKFDFSIDEYLSIKCGDSFAFNKRYIKYSFSQYYKD